MSDRTETKPPAGLKRIAECGDIAVLQLIGDEVQAMPEGPDRDALLAALTERDRELADAGVST